MTDRYKVWQDLSKILRDKHQSMKAYIYDAEALLGGDGGAAMYSTNEEVF
jgi:hypothetical protein